MEYSKFEGDEPVRLFKGKAGGAHQASCRMMLNVACRESNHRESSFGSGEGHSPDYWLCVSRVLQFLVIMATRDDYPYLLVIPSIESKVRGESFRFFGTNERSRLTCAVYDRV